MRIFSDSETNRPRGMEDIFISLVEVKRRTGRLEMELLNTLSDPFGLKGYKSLDRL